MTHWAVPSPRAPIRPHAIPLAVGFLVLALIACNLTAVPGLSSGTVVPNGAGAPAATGAPPTEATPSALPPATSAGTRTLDLTKFKPLLDDAVAVYLQADKATACSVAVVYPLPGSGKLQAQVYNYGTLSKTTATPADSNTFYEIGSLTKLFTSELFALYVEQGAMQLNDPVQKYLPANVHMPTFNNQAITLVQLVTHTSGLPRSTGGVPPLSQVNGVTVWGYATDAQVFSFLDSYQLTRAPGAKWEYSNLSTDLSLKFSSLFVILAVDWRDDRHSRTDPRTG